MVPIGLLMLLISSKVSINKTHYSKQLGLWMAVGEGGSHTVATSTDGINWTGKGMVFNIRGKKCLLCSRGMGRCWRRYR